MLPPPLIPKLHIGIKRPEEVVPRLGKPDLHWKVGRSAFCLANAWVGANDFPPRVKAVFKQDAQYIGASLVAGFFERETDLRTKGRPSQTDLLAIASLGKKLAVIGVEGKVDEPFGDVVNKWNDRSSGKVKRLIALCQTLCLDQDSCGALRYQLLHRSAAAIYEAQNFCCQNALMLVHSFSSKHACFDDFLAFSIAMKMPVRSPDMLSRSRKVGGVAFRLSWVSDLPAGASI
jgi:hypothetical protein